MISGDFTHCKTLEEFYKEIRALHEEEYGKEYCEVHDELSSRIAYGSHGSYREFGINQGATSAAALLAKPKRMEIYDVNLHRFMPYKNLFRKFAIENRIKFDWSSRSSLSPDYNFKPVDLLYIDTIHKKKHLLKELDIHSKFVKKTIVMHDTYSKPEMHEAVINWIEDRPWVDEWELEEYNTNSVGFTVIRRKDA